MRSELLAQIQRDREIILAFIRDFVRIPTPNPPGDTMSAMQHVRALLDSKRVTYDIHARDTKMPNLVASSALGTGPKHLVLNGHIDVFPVENPSEWAFDPWAATVSDDSIYGRGVADMKVGTTASLFTYLYLQQFKPALKGRLTLTVVSDEETFGPNGARHLFDTCPESITGTACLNGEPSSPHTIRFGEKGALWLRFVVTTPGGHGAYAHVSKNAIESAFALVQDLKMFKTFEFQEPPEVVAALESSQAAFDAANGPGASRLARSITMNLGTMVAGPKVNMIASRCEFEIDIRIPNGVTRADVINHVESLRDHHGFSYEVLMSNDSNWCEPESELAQIVRKNARDITGIEPANVIGLGNTDARLWRYRGTPAVVYGPTPRGMGSVNEHVRIDEALNVIRCHVLSAFEYLST